MLLDDHVDKILTKTPLLRFHGFFFVHFNSKDMTLRPLAVNNVNNENGKKARSSVCSCRSNESLDAAAEIPRNTKDAKDINQNTDGSHGKICTVLIAFS